MGRRSEGTAQLERLSLLSVIKGRGSTLSAAREVRDFTPHTASRLGGLGPGRVDEMMRGPAFELL